MVRLLILVLALGSGGLAAWLALAANGSEAPAAAVAESAKPVPVQEILVAAGDVQRGARITGADMRWQPWPEEGVSSGLISRSERPSAIEELQASVANSGFIAGEPIRQEKLVPAGSGYLAFMLPSGKRAIAVRVTAENAAGGFILPNDRVDVVHTTSRTLADGEVENTSRTVLTNVRVLAVDQTANEDEAGTALVAKTATLELDMRQVEIVTAAESSGTLSLALRSAEDNDEEPTVSEAIDSGNRKKGVVRMIRSGRTELVEIPGSG